MSNDAYRAVTVTLRQRRPDSIMVENPRVLKWQTIPRSLIHAADDLRIDRGGLIDREITIRVMEWKCEELGLA